MNGMLESSIIVSVLGNGGVHWIGDIVGVVMSVGVLILSIVGGVGGVCGRIS